MSKFYPHKGDHHKKGNGAGKSELIVNAKDKYGWTPLYCACHHGSTECVTLLVKDLGKLLLIILLILY